MCVEKSTQTALRAFGRNSSVHWTGHTTLFRRSSYSSMWTSSFGGITTEARRFSLYWSQRLRSDVYQVLKSKFSSHKSIIYQIYETSQPRMPTYRNWHRKLPEM